MAPKTKPTGKTVAPKKVVSNKFPLNFIEVPMKTFDLENSSDRVYSQDANTIREILKDYDFHSFAASNNRGCLILCFVLKQ